MGAITQWWLYHCIEKRGASNAWCRAGKDRAKVQIMCAVIDMLRLIGAIICAVIISLAVYILTGGM